MKRTWTIVGVRDVPGSFKWYQSLFGQPATPPGHDYFGQIVDTDGTVLLCLHQWGAHDHPSLMTPDEASPGNGLLLFFRVDDYDEALNRARALVARFEEEPHVNPNTHTREFSLRDPDGYYVTISALSEPRPGGSAPSDLVPNVGPMRPLRAFIVAPLIAVACCWLLLVSLGIPRGVQEAPFFFLLVYMPTFVLPMYVLVLIVGLLGYLLLRRLNRLGASAFAVLFSGAGVLFMIALLTNAHQWQRPFATSFVIISGVVGAATGAAFGRLLLPRAARPLDSRR